MLDAAYAILVDAGLSGFSVDAVAGRSGVAKTTIYRSWPTKSMLMFESFREVFETQLAFEHTGSPERDLRALIGSLARALGGQAGRLAASVIAAAQSDADIKAQFVEYFSDPLRQRSAAVIHRGIESGQFRSDLDVPRLLDAAVGAVYLRLLLGLPLDDAWADALALTLLRGSNKERGSAGISA